MPVMLIQVRGEDHHARDVKEAVANVAQSHFAMKNSPRSEPHVLAEHLWLLDTHHSAEALRDQFGAAGLEVVVLTMNGAWAAKGFGQLVAWMETNAG